MKKIIICLTGMPGSGKSTVADMLKERGFTMVEMSAQLKTLMGICGVPFNMKSREAFAVNLKKSFGRDILAKLSTKEVLGAKSHVVISGVRSTDELNYIRTLSPHVATVALSVPKETRFERIIGRKAGIRTKSYREFEWRDKKNVAMGLLQVIHAADYALPNTGTLSELNASLDKLLRKLERKAERRNAIMKFINHYEMNTSKNLVVCLTGMPGSGKSTVADMLKARGFTMVEHSRQIKKLMCIGGMKVNAETIETFVPELKETFGRDVVSKLSSKLVMGSRGNVVISGPRDPAELAFIRKMCPRVVVVAVSAPRKMRYSRLVKRKEGIKTTSRKEFEWRDRKNIALGTMRLVKSADYLLMNTGTMAQLRSNIDELIRTLRGKKAHRV
jgi:dephospho-CoA kinase